MEYFALLTTATIVIVALAFALFRKYHDYGVLVGVAALYYWSLYGAWNIVIDKTGGYSGQRYYYLEHKLFPIVLDGSYMLSLVLYSAFIIVVEVTLLLALKRVPRRAIQEEATPLTLRHGSILLIAALAALASVYFIQDKLQTAWALNTSAYVYTRQETDQWFTLHQVLNHVALIPTAIGFAMLLAGRGKGANGGNRFFVNVVRRYTFPAYLALFAAMGAFAFVLGNKNEVFMALLVGFLAFMGASRRARLWKVSLVLVAGMWFLATIDFFRGAPLSELGTAISERLAESSDVGSFVTSSNEAYGSHFSMYGVLAQDTQPLYGYSLYSLICSVVPRVLWRDRPLDIYFYYSESVGAIQNQGYSIHHATGWYLSFGYAGVGLGAVVMGLIWAYCINARQRIRPKSRMPFRLFATIAPWVFVASIPGLVRAGPEGYKGLAVDGFLVPMSALVFACTPRKAKRRLAWNPQTGWAVATR